MKIKQIMIKNFASINKVEINLKDDVVYLVGINGAGKTGIGLNAVWMCLQGLAQKGKDVLHGERFRFIGKYGKSAIVQLTLHDEIENIDIVINRKLTKSKTELKIKASDGRHLPDNFINSIFNIFSINPVGFAKLSSKEQAVALGIDTQEYDKQKLEKYEERKEINYEVKRLDGILNEIGGPRQVQKVDIQKLLKKKNQIDETNAKVVENAQTERGKKVQIAIQYNDLQNSKQIDVDKAIKEIEKIEDNIKLVRNDFEKAKKTFEMAKTIFKKEELLFKNDSKNHACAHTKALEDRNDLPIPYEQIPTDISFVQPDKEDTSALMQQIEQAEITNVAANKYQTFLVADKKYNDAIKKQTDKNDEMEQIENDRIAYIKSCKLPFSNISIDEQGGMLISGRPFSETYFSKGEILRMGIKLISTTKPILRYIFIPDARNIDDDNREKLFEELVAAGFQVVAEMVDTKQQKDHTTILLKESKIVDSYESIEEKLL